MLIFQVILTDVYDDKHVSKVVFVRYVWRPTYSLRVFINGSVILMRRQTLGDVLSLSMVQRFLLYEGASLDTGLVCLVGLGLMVIGEIRFLLLGVQAGDLDDVFMQSWNIVSICLVVWVWLLHHSLLEVFGREVVVRLVVFVLHRVLYHPCYVVGKFCASVSLHAKNQQTKHFHF